MYGLSKDIDLTFFQNKQLLQVCLGANEVILNFHEGPSMTIMASFSCGADAENLPRYEDPRQAAAALVQLINGTITSVQGSEDGTLALRFDNGQTLKVYDDSQQYESYTIGYQDKFIVV